MCADPGVCGTSLLANGWEIAPGMTLSNRIMGLLAKSFRYMIQSGPDGACPLMMAAFSSGAQSGDFYTPSVQIGYCVGPYVRGPVQRTIVGGIPGKPDQEETDALAPL